MATEGEIRQQLGFDASQAISELAKLNPTLAALGSHLGSLAGSLSAFNARSDQTVASLRQMSTAANAAFSSVSKLGSMPKSLDAALGVGKITEGMKGMQDAARLGTSVYSGAMSSMTEQTRTATRTITEAQKSTMNWVVSWETLGRVVMTQFIVRALSQIRDAMREAYSSAMDFTKHVSEIHAILPERTFGQMADEVRQLSDAFNQPLSRTLEAEYQTISDQFVTTTDRLNIMTAANALAKTGADDLAAAAQLLTGALNAYGESSDMAGLRAAQFFESVNLGRFRMGELGTAMGRVQSIAHELGVSMEELQAALIAITIGGVKSSEAATQLRGILTALMKPTVDMQKALKEIGAVSAEDAIKTWEFRGTLEKLKATTDGTAEAMGKLFPNVRGIGGALRLLAEGATSYEQAMERLRAQDFSILQKKLKDFMDTDAQKLTKELNKLANFFTAEFGLKLISTLNGLIQVLGGGSGLTGVLRTLTSTIPTDVLLIGGLALAFVKVKEMAAAAKTTTTDMFGSVVTKAPAATKAVGALRTALGALVAIEVGRMLGNQLGELINTQLEASNKALRDGLDAQLKMREQQSAAAIREEERKNTELIRVLRQHFAEANKLYMQDAENYKAAVRVEVANVKNAFDQIMSMRQRLTQELGAAAEKAARSAVESEQRVAGIQQQIADRSFNANIQLRGLSPEWQFKMYSDRVRQLADEAAKLQASAKDTDQEKLADQAWRRAEAYAQMSQEAAKQSGSVVLQRRSLDQLNTLSNQQIESVKKQAAGQKQLAAELEARKRQADENNASLERGRDAIEGLLSAWKKTDTGELTQKSSEQFKKDLGEASRMIDAWIKEVQATTKGDFLKNFMGDAEAFKQMKRDAERLLSSVYLQELKVAPEAMAALRDQLQAALNKAGLTVPVVAQLEGFTNKEVITEGATVVFDAAEKRLKEIAAQTKARNTELANQVDIRAIFAEARTTLGEEPMTTVAAGSGWTKKRADQINDARRQLVAVVAEMDRLAQSTKITDKEMGDLQQAIQGIDLKEALSGLGNLFERKRMAEELLTLSSTLAKLKESQAKTPEAVPEKERQEAEAIRQQIEAIRQKTEAQRAATGQVQQERAALEGGKIAIDNQVSSVAAGLPGVQALASAWWDAAAGAAAAAQSASAASSPASGTVAGEGLVSTGGLIRLLATGGAVRYLGSGSGPRGSDVIPAMLSPDEFVVNANSTRRFYSQLMAINAGVQPAYRSDGGSVTNIGDVSITVNESKTPDQTAKTVWAQIQRAARRGTIRL